MNTILGLDTSSENCSVALGYQGQTVQALTFAPRNHTKLILPMVQTLLADHSLALEDMQALAFGCGPGSFTGIRIAAGVAQGLAFGLNIPIYAISNLQALALQSYLQHGNPRVLACIDARMGEVYWGLFEVGTQTSVQGQVLYSVQPLIEEQVSAADQVCIPENLFLSGANQATGAWAAIGSGLASLEDFSGRLVSCLAQQDDQAQPEAQAIVRLAQTAISSGQKGELQDALPSYVRDSVAWNKLPGRE